MATFTEIKILANKYLAPANIQIATLTAERAEAARLANVAKSGHFDRPVFPTLRQFVQCDFRPILAAVSMFKEETARFAAPSQDGQYSFINEYFDSPDAEVAYALVRQLHPDRIIEVGSGNSTRLFRQAIRAGGLQTKLMSIDPFPRVEIEAASDHFVRSRLEQLPSSFLPDLLAPGDFLFIDSSHEIRVGNDVLTLLLSILPALRPGVVMHLHDIFLPYEYPREWIISKKWDQFREQYLVQALLQDSAAFDVLWPGHFLQRTAPNFGEHFSGQPLGVAKSLWLRKVS